MNIKEAKQEIKNTIAVYLKKDSYGEYRIPDIRQRPLLLIGPPGIGKTQIVSEVAAECGIGLVSYTITHHTRQSAVGLPFIREETFAGEKFSVTEYTMSEIIASVYREMEKSGKKEGILFIDEINCVSETLAPTMLQFLQCKKFGNQSVPQGWIIVTAGNPPEYNKSVREFDVVTLDRVRQIEIGADYKVWREYARNAGIHGAIMGYLDLHKENFYRIENDVDGMHFVTARGWEDFSCLLYLYREENIPVTEDVIFEYLPHRDVAEDLAAYLELYVKYEEEYPVSDILSGEVKSVIYERLTRAGFDERVTVTEYLLTALFQVIREYLMAKEYTDLWYDFLKKYRSRIGEDIEKRELYFQMMEQMEISGVREQVLKKMLNCSVPPLGLGEREAFEEAKKGFLLQKEKMEQAREKAKQAVEAAFSFVENAFGEGEEMVLFVTELTITADSVRFLAEEPNEKYLKYSEELLIGTRRQEILSEIKNL